MPNIKGTTEIKPAAPFPFKNQGYRFKINFTGRISILIAHLTAGADLNAC